MTPLNADTVKHAAHPRLIGQVAHYGDEVDSTNAALLRLIKEGAVEGTIVLADKQTAGRGRVGKPWFSPQGCLVVNLADGSVVRVREGEASPLA